MEKWVGFEIVAMGKMDDYTARVEARDKRHQELGLARPNTYQVLERKHNMVFFEWPAMTPEERQEWLAQVGADEVIGEFERKRTEMDAQPAPTDQTPLAQTNNVDAFAAFLRMYNAAPGAITPHIGQG